jgi:hypothetical protein
VHTHTHCLPTFWAAPSNFLSLPSRQFVKKQIPYMGTTYPCSLSLKKHIRIKHVRRANWVAPTCPQGCFLVFEGVSQLGGANIPLRDVYYLFDGVGDFLSSSHQIPLVPLISHQNSFCSHQVPKQFSSNSSYSHQ